MIATASVQPEGLVARVRRQFRNGLDVFESSPLSAPVALRERWIEAVGGHPTEADSHTHRREAIAWLERAQDAGKGGFARGYGLATVPGIGRRGWQDPYPETTGYIIPTLYAAAWAEERPLLTKRATSAARWVLEVQQPSGAIPAGMLGQGDAPAVFNTGQAMFGWLCALHEVGDTAFADATIRAGRWLASQLDQDGIWRRGNSPYADAEATMYNARTAWAMVAAGQQLSDPALTASGAVALRAVVHAQRVNGWIPDCCLTDSSRPLTHTLAYTVQGLLEGGVLLADEGLISAATRIAAPMADALRPDGFLPGRFDERWRPAVEWSCLTGTAQMASVWFRLSEIDNDSSWTGPAAAAIHYLKRTQNRSSDDLGLRGGIKGSSPCTGDYGRLQTLSWATKFFVDALLRQSPTGSAHARVRAADCLLLA